jgi:hypothetical protein
VLRRPDDRAWLLRLLQDSEVNGSAGRSVNGRPARPR